MFAEIVEHSPAPGPSTGPEIPPLVKTSAGNVLVHFLGSLRIGNDAVVPTQLDLDATAGALREIVGSIDLSQATSEGSQVLMEVGYSQTLVGKVVKLKEPIALIRPKELKSGTLSAEIVHYEIFFGTQPLPRVAKRPLE